MPRTSRRPLAAALILSLLVLLAGLLNAPAPTSAPAVAAPVALVCPTGYTPKTLRVLTYRDGGYVQYLELQDRRDEAEEALRTPGLTDRQRRIWQRRLATANRLLLDAVLVNTSNPPDVTVRVCAAR